MIREAPRVNLKHLRAFVSVAKHHSFTRAGNELGLSQPAVSALVSQLEEDLATQLFERTTRLVQLTPAGEEFENSSSRILDELQRAILEVKGYSRMTRGRLNIAALPSLCEFFLPGILRQFHEDFPGIELAISDLPANRIIEAAKSGVIDFGISHVEGNDPLLYAPLLDDHLVAVAARRLFPADQREITWEELSSHEVIAMAAGTSMRSLIDAGAHAAGVRLRIVLQPRQMASAVAFAQAGLGVTLLPSSVARSTPEHTVLEVVGPKVHRPISIVRSPDAVWSPPAKAFLELLNNLPDHNRDADSA